MFRSRMIALPIMIFLVWAFAHMLGCKFHIEEKSYKSKSFNSTAKLLFYLGPVGWIDGVVRLVNAWADNEFKGRDELLYPMRVRAFLPTRMTDGKFVFLRFYYIARATEKTNAFLHRSTESDVCKFRTLDLLERHFMMLVMERFFKAPDAEFMWAAGNPDRLKEWGWKQVSKGGLNDGP